MSVFPIFYQPAKIAKRFKLPMLSELPNDGLWPKALAPERPLSTDSVEKIGFLELPET
ncbi:hypothetical protein [Pseudomonas syringae]|uniref:hypothetical protein n=1 Tax=Pseudomonas syringae TaxID=317 RepID=UPI00178327CB|nr:hypothetical protein [Pseudomonas syringae]